MMDNFLRNLFLDGPNAFWTFLIENTDGISSLRNLSLIFIAIISIFYVRRQFRLQNAQHKMTTFLGAVNFINHDVQRGINRDSVLCGISTFKAITMDEDLGHLKKGEFIYSITITRFLTEHIRKIEDEILWKDFYFYRLKDYYEIGFLIFIMTKTLPAKPVPTFYCFVDFAEHFKKIYHRHFESFLSKSGQTLFEELLQNIEKNITHLRNEKKRAFSFKKLTKKKWQHFISNFKKIPKERSNNLYKGFRDEDFNIKEDVV